MLVIGVTIAAVLLTYFVTYLKPLTRYNWKLWWLGPFLFLLDISMIYILMKDYKKRK